MFNYLQNTSFALHLAQLNKTWQRSRYNRYSDPAKQEYHETLESLFLKLIEIDSSSLTPVAIDGYKIAADFLFKSVEFLDSSTLNLIPFETVECLSYALEDWRKETDNFIIVTNLVKDLSGYSFDPTLVRQGKYDRLLVDFDITFKSKLIQINVPAYLSRDYLSSVVLYHELGHFINEQYKVCESIFARIVDLDLDIIENKALFEHFFHFDRLRFEKWKERRNDPDTMKKIERLMLSYLGEYFCDLFSVQYSGNSFPQYLDYIEPDASQTSTHPSKNRRIELMEAFLNDRSSSPAAKTLINIYQNALQKILGKSLSIRYTLLDNQCFYDLLPAQIENEKQLHAVFIQGWECWSKSKRHSDIDRVASLKESPMSRYEIINNLMEKSIGNFIVKRDWEKNEI
ncbi:MAG: hypothetical protein ACK5Z2_04565 [Bacteroidota bacterium]|jgi:hypothetical protein